MFSEKHYKGASRWISSRGRQEGLRAQPPGSRDRRLDPGRSREARVRQRPGIPGSQWLVDLLLADVLVYVLKSNSEFSRLYGSVRRSCVRSIDSPLPPFVAWMMLRSVDAVHIHKAGDEKCLSRQVNLCQTRCCRRLDPTAPTAVSDRKFVAQFFLCPLLDMS